MGRTHSSTPRRVVVTGIGVVSAVGMGKDAFFAGLTAGRSGVRTITRFDTTGYPVSIAAEIADFEAGDFLDRKAARRMDRYAQYAVTAALMARDDAAFPRPRPIPGGGHGGQRHRRPGHLLRADRDPHRARPRPGEPLFIP